MNELGDKRVGQPTPRVINLADAPGERQTWGRPAAIVYAWSALELLVLYNPWQISSTLRVKVLRAFGASIGCGVIIRPRTRIKYPWKLQIGDRCWIGEGAWIHNQDHVKIGSDAVISQEVFITTGSHALAADMALVTKPVVIADGVWLATRSMVLGGAHIGTSAVVAPNIVIPPNTIIGQGEVLGLDKPRISKQRFS